MTFAAQWLAYALPCRRFACALASANARLGADVDRYSFIASDLHRLLLADLPAHNPLRSTRKSAQIATLGDENRITHARIVAACAYSRRVPSDVPLTARLVVTIVQSTADALATK